MRRMMRYLVLSVICIFYKSGFYMFCTFFVGGFDSIFVMRFGAILASAFAVPQRLCADRYGHKSNLILLALRAISHPSNNKSHLRQKFYPRFVLTAFSGAVFTPFHA